MLKISILFLSVIFSISLLVSCTETTSVKPSDDEIDTTQVSVDDDVADYPDHVDAEEIKELEDYLIRNPLDYSAAYQLARRYETIGDVDKAISVYSRYYESDDINIANQAKYDTLILHIRQGNHKRAYDGLNEILDDVSLELRANIYYELGNLLYVEGFEPPDGQRKKRALDYYQKALEINPSSLITYRRIAYLNHELGNIETAREYLAIFLMVYSDDAGGWLDLAEWSVEVSDRDNARAYFERAKMEGSEEIKRKAERALRNL